MSFSFKHYVMNRLVINIWTIFNLHVLIWAPLMREPALLDLHITPEPLCQRSTSSDKGRNWKAAYGKESCWTTSWSAYRCNELFLLALKRPRALSERMIAAPCMPLIHDMGRSWKLKIAVVVHVFCNTERVEGNGLDLDPFWLLFYFMSLWGSIRLHMMR